jgi:hypothetical protein
MWKKQDTILMLLMEKLEVCSPPLSLSRITRRITTDDATAGYSWPFAIGSPKMDSGDLTFSFSFSFNCFFLFRVHMGLKP